MDRVRASGSVRRGRWALAAAASLTASSIFGSYAQGAGIKGMHVVSGHAIMKSIGDHTVIKAGNRAIIRYDSFNVPLGGSVRFVQPSKRSTVLNRITGNAPSRIDGMFSSNGIVYFVNPAGITFGPKSVVNVGQIFAAAGNISDNDFKNGVNRFTMGPGRVDNQGYMKGDAIHLLGSQVSNSGAIVADRGIVTMTAATGEVYIKEDGEKILVQPSNDPANPVAAGSVGVENTGSVKAEGGMVKMMGAGDIYSFAVKNAGMVKANQIEVAGGNGTVSVGGTLDASSQQGGQKGGTVQITGDKVALDGAKIDASGKAGGGTVLVGGDAHGQGTVPTASATNVSADTQIHADGMDNGDAGKVVIWSNGLTNFYGSITARGGSQGGNGGWVEVSGKGTLVYQGTVDTTAPKGAIGTLLLDPTDIDVVGAGPANTSLLTDVDDFADANIGGGTKLDVTSINNAAANVLLEATNNITFSTPVSIATAGVGLTARAGNDIVVNTSIKTKGGAVVLSADDNNGVHDGSGVVDLDGGGSIDTSNTVATGADITLRGADVHFSTSNGLKAGTNGVVTLAPIDATSTIGVGGGAGTLQISDAEIGKITTASKIVIGEQGIQSGAVTVKTITLAAGNAGIEINSDSGAGGVVLDTDDGGTPGSAIATGGSGTITVRAGTGGITAAQNTALAELSTTGAVVLASGDIVGSVANKINLTGATSVAATGVGNVVLAHDGAVTLNNSSSAAAFSLQAGGAITVANAQTVQGASVSLTTTTGDITAVGASIATTAGDLTLSTASGKIGTNAATRLPITVVGGALVANATGDISVAGTGNLTLGTVTSGATLTASSTGAMDVQAAKTAAGHTVSLTTTGGSITTGAGSLIQSTAGGVSLNASTQIGTSAANRAAVSVTGGSLQVSSNGDVFVTSGAALDVRTISPTGAGRDVEIQTTAGALSLSLANVTDDNLTLNSAAALTVNSSQTAATITATAAGDITGAGTLTTTTGDLTLNSTGGKIGTSPASPLAVGVGGAGKLVLTTGGAAAAGNVSITSSAALAVGAITTAGSAQSIDIQNSAGGLTIAAASTTNDTVNLASADAITLNASVTAASLTVHSGTDGSGNIGFGAGVSILADTQSYQAGSGAGAAATADLGTNTPAFSNTAGLAGPNSFTHRSDGNVTDALLASGFPNGTPTSYSIISDGGSVAVSTPAKVVNTNLTLNGATGVTIGGAINVASLDVTGATTLSTAAVTSAGAMTFHSGVTLNAATVTLSASGSLQAAAITGGANDLTFDGGAAGTITVSGAVSGVNTLTITNSNGATFQNTVSASSIALSDTQAGKAIAFQGNLTVTTGNLTSAATANAYNVAITGAANSVAGSSTFANTGTLTIGSAGGTSTFTAGLNTTAVGSTVTLNGTVASTNNSITLGAVTLGSATTINSNGGAISVGAVTGGTNDLTLNGGASGGITVTGAIGGVGVLTVANSNGATFQSTVGAASVALSDTTAGQTILFQDNVTTAGNVASSASANGYDVTFAGVNNAISGSGTFANIGTLTIGSAGGTSTFTGGLNTTAVGSTVTLNGTVASTNNPITLGAITLGSTTAINSNGGAITIGAITGGNNALTLNGGGAGSINLTAAASGLSSLQATAQTITLHNVTTIGNQLYTATTTTLSSTLQTNGGAVTLTGALHLASTSTIDTSSDNSADGGQVDLSGATVSATAGATSLTLDTSNTTATHSGGAVLLGVFDNSGGSNVNNLTINSRGDAATPATDALVTLNSAMTLGGAVSIASGGVTQAGGTLTSNGLLLQGRGTYTLTQANSVNTVAARVLGSINLTDANPAGLAIGTVGGIAGIKSGDANDGVNTGNGGNVTLTSAGQLAINAVVDTSGGAGGSLSISDGTTLGAIPVLGAGNITLSGVGNLIINVPLTITPTDNPNFASSGDIIINAAITSTGGQDLSFHADFPVSDGQGGVQVSSTGQLSSSGTLTLKGSAGITFSSAVGVQLDGPISAAGITTLDTNNVEKIGLGANVTTTGSLIDFKKDVTLTGSPTVASGGGNITFEGKIDAAAAGVQGLTLTAGAGNVLLSGAVGSTTPLGTLTVSGTDISAQVNISTVSNQSYAGAGIVTLNGTYNTDGGSFTITGNDVRLAGNVVVDTEQLNDGAGGAVVLTNATISGNAAGRDLTIDTSTGAAGAAGGAVSLGTLGAGGGNAVNDLTIDSHGGTADGLLTLGGPVAMAANAGDTADADWRVGGTSQGVGAILTADTLLLRGNAGANSFTLGEANNIGTLAANVNGALSVKTAGALTVGTVNAIDGITTTNHDATLNVGGGLLITQPINSGTQNISLSAAGPILEAGAGAVLGSALVATTNNTPLADLTLGGANNMASIDLQSAGVITYHDVNSVDIARLVTTSVAVPALNLTTAGGDITTSNPLATINIAGAVTVNAAGNLTFGGVDPTTHASNSVFGPITADAGGDINITHQGLLIVTHAQTPTGDITFASTTISLAGLANSIASIGGDLRIKPLDPASNMTIGGVADTINAAQVTTIANTFNQVIIGDDAGTGVITFASDITIPTSVKVIGGSIIDTGATLATLQNMDLVANNGTIGKNGVPDNFFNVSVGGQLTITGDANVLNDRDIFISSSVPLVLSTLDSATAGTTIRIQTTNPGSTLTVAGTITTPADLIFDSSSSFVVNDGVTLTGNSISVTAAGQISDGGAGVLVTTGGNLTLHSTTSAAAGIGASVANALNVRVDAAHQLVLATDGPAANGDIFITSDQNLNLGAVSTDAGTAQTVDIRTTNNANIAVAAASTTNDNWTINSAGNIGGGATITAASANLTAATGIGSVGTPVSLVSPQIAAHTTSGDIDITNGAPGGAVTVSDLSVAGTGNIAFSQLGASAVSVNGVTAADGSVSLQTAGGSMTLGGAVSAAGANGSITLLTTGAGDVLVNNPINAATTATITAGHDISLASTTDATTSVAMTAGNSINGGGVITSPTINLNATNGIGNAIQVLTAGPVGALSQSVTLQAGAGGINVANDSHGAATTLQADANSGGSVTFVQSGGLLTVSGSAGADFTLTNTTNDILIGSITAGATATISATASGAAINEVADDDAGATSVEITAQNLALTAGDGAHPHTGGIGTTSVLDTNVPGNLSFTSDGDVRLSNSVGFNLGPAASTVHGNLTLIAKTGNITTSGTLTVQDNLILTTDAGSITTGALVNVGGTADFSATGGDITTNAAVTTGGDTTFTASTFGRSVNIHGGLTVNNAGDLTITADDIDLAPGAGLPNSIVGTGSILLQTADPTRGIYVGPGPAPANFMVISSTTDLPALAEGFTNALDPLAAITIGRANGTGPIIIDAGSFKDAVTFRTTGAGTITINGQLDSLGDTNVDGPATITLRGPNGGGAGTLIRGSIVTNGADVLIDDNVRLFGGAIASIDTTNGNPAGAGANIDITGFVTGTTSGAESLVLTAGTGGTITLGGNVGGTRLGTFTVVSAQLASLQGLATTGDATITADEVDFGGGAGSVTSSGGILTLRPNAANTGINVGSAATANANSLDLSSTDLAALGSGWSKIVVGYATTGNGITTIGDAAFPESVEFEQPLSPPSGLDLTGAIVVGHSGASDGHALFDGAVQVDSNSSVSAGPITFNQQLTGNGNLALDSGAATTTFQGKIITLGSGSGAALTIHTSGLTLFKDTVSTNSGIVADSTLGTLQFTHDVSIAAGDTATNLAGNVILDNQLGGTLTFHSGGAVTFGTDANNALQILNGNAAITTSNAALNIHSKTDGDPVIQPTLTLDSGSANTTFFAAVGSIHPLGTITIHTSGTTDFQSTLTGAGGIVADADHGTVSFEGNVDMTGPTTLAGNVNLNGITYLSRGGVVNFGSAVSDQIRLGVGGVTVTTQNALLNFNGTTDGAEDLTVDSGSANTTFFGAVGGTTPLANVTIHTGALTEFKSTLAATGSLLADANHGTAIFDGNVNIGGTSRLDGNVTLNGVTFHSNGTINLGSAADDQTTLATGPVAITTTNSAINVNGLLDGGQNLTLDSGTANTTLFAAVGSATPVGNGTGAAITINSRGTTDFKSTLAANSGINATADHGTVTFDGNVNLAAGDTGTTLAGNVNLNGVTFASGNSVSFGNAVDDAILLGVGPVNVSTSGHTLNFNGHTDGAQALTVDSGVANTTFFGPVGGVQPLGAITTNASGTTEFKSTLAGAGGLSATATNGTVIFDGNVNMTGATALNGNVTFNGITYQSQGGSVNLGDAAGDQITLATGPVTINTSGNVLNFNGLVDGGQALTLDSGSAKTTFAAPVGSGVALGAILIHTSGNTEFQSTLSAGSTLTADADHGTVTFDGNATVVGATNLSGNVVLNGITYSGAAITFGSATDDQITLATGAVTVNATGNLTFNGKTDGAVVLNVNSGASPTLFVGAVGSATPITDLNIATSGTTHFQSTLAASGNLAATADTGAVIFDGNVNINGTSTLNGNSTFNGIIFTGGGAITLGNALTDQVTLGVGAVTIKTTGNSAIAVNGKIDGAQGLTVDSGTATTTFFGAVGSSTPLGAIVIHTSGTTEFKSTLATAGAGAGLTADADHGSLIFDDDVNLAGAAALSGQTTLNGITFHAGGAIDFGNAADDATTLATGAVSVTGGNTITFHGAVDGAQNLGLDSGSNATTFNVAVGANTPIGSGTGFAITIATTGDTEFKGTLNTASGIRATSSQGRVIFDRDVTIAAGDSATNLSGDVRIDNQTGSQLHFQSGGAVTLGSAPSNTVTISHGDLLLKAKTINVKAKTKGDLRHPNLTADAGSVTMADISGLGTLAITANSGARQIHVSNVSTGGDQDYTASADINLNGDHRVTGTGHVRFQGPVTLGDNVTIQTNGSSATSNIEFDGGVGRSGGQAHDLSVSTLNGNSSSAVVYFVVGAGNAVSSTLDVRSFKVNGLTPNQTRGSDSGVATVAVIGGSVAAPADFTGDFNVKATGGVDFGSLERLTVLGNLNITAGGQVGLGDTSVLNKLTVIAPSVLIHTRGPADVRDVNLAASKHTLRTDIIGVDGISMFSAANSNVPPQILFDGANRTVNLATNGGATTIAPQLLQSQPGFSVFQESPQILAADFIANDHQTVLSQIAKGEATTFQRVVAPRQIQFVRVNEGISTGLFAGLEDLGIRARELDVNELLAFLQGVTVYNDVPGDRLASVEGQQLPYDYYRVTRNRLAQDAVVQVINEFHDLFLGAPEVDENGQPKKNLKGDVIRTSLQPQIKKTLEDSVSTYATEKKITTIDPLAYRKWVEETPAQAKALEYLNKLRDLFNHIYPATQPDSHGGLGITPLEASLSRAAIIRTLDVSNIDPLDLETAILGAPVPKVGIAAGAQKQ